MPLDANIRFVDVAGTRTRYYDDGGGGDPIVLIHGAHHGFVIPIGIEQWELNLPALAGCGRIIAFDKLGQGYTDAPAEDARWTFETLADHAIGFIEALGLRNVVLVGHSRGGLLALDIAIKRPDLVKRLAVISSASAAPATAAPIVNPAAAMAVGQMAPDAVLALLATAQATDRPVPPGFARFVLDVVALAKYADEGATLARVDATYWGPSLATAQKRVLDHLGKVGLAMPTLLVWGMNDRSAPIAMGHALFEIVAGTTPDASMLVLNRAGHNLFIDQAEAFNAAIASFAAA